MNMLSLKHLLALLNSLLGRLLPDIVCANSLRSTHKQHINLTSSLAPLACPSVTVSTSYATVTANVTSTTYVSSSPFYNSSSSTQIASQGFLSSSANFTSAATNSTTGIHRSVSWIVFPFFPMTMTDMQKSSPPHSTSCHFRDFHPHNDKHPHFRVSSVSGKRNKHTTPKFDYYTK
jgi:hypothetical protein